MRHRRIAPAIGRRRKISDSSSKGKDFGDAQGVDRMRTWLAAVVTVCLMPAAAAAQGTSSPTSYPTKPVSIVVPASPGGVTDALGRMLAQRFTEAWGQQVIVENKPGANNQIAAEYVTKSAPDGYTLFIGPETTFVVNPSLYPKLPYDPVRVSRRSPGWSPSTTP
jgi:tripartite-type tricarboxylate transporter receptor subunit TctC